MVTAPTAEPGATATLVAHHAGTAQKVVRPSALGNRCRRLGRQLGLWGGAYCVQNRQAALAAVANLIAVRIPSIPAHPRPSRIGRSFPTYGAIRLCES